MLGYDDQTVYEGEFLNGLRHGQGAIVFENGDIYEGGWFEGQRTGPDGDATEGIYVAHDGKEIYQGGFLDNKRHGNGWVSECVFGPDLLVCLAVGCTCIHIRIGPKQVRTYRRTF